MGRRRTQKSVVRRQKAEGRRQYRHPRTRIAFAQNFLTSERLVRRLVRRASIGSEDIVLDIGAGRGVITAELVRVAGHVIAIERDPRLVRHLRERFRESGNVEVVEGDFMRYRIPVREYKVFANIPYNKTASIVGKLLDSRVCEAHLIMQKEPARRFTGGYLFSLLSKPFFEFEIVHQLQRTDFHPVPNVDSVLLRIRRRHATLVGEGYREFVSYGFSRHKRNLRLSYKDVFTYTQWKRAARKLGFDLNATATQLTFEQWVGLYQEWAKAPVARVRNNSLRGLVSPLSR